MVSRTLKRSKAINRLLMTILIILIVVIVVLVALIFNTRSAGERGSDAESSSETSTTNDEPKRTSPAKIDFQPVVDDWANSTSGDKSIAIFDLDRNELLASYNTDKHFDTASLYKLFVVYEGYRRVQSGEWDGGELTGQTDKTILKCLDLAIRESNSTCAEAIWGMIGRKELDRVVRDELKIKHTDVSALSSNVNDITLMMKMFYRHKQITDDKLVEQLKDSFLNQPATEYDWRQGLPSGFEKANVYNKVGWDYNPDEKRWNLYHDASIIEFPDDNRHFIVVVMTSHIAPNKIAELGRSIEAKYLSQ
ncbi:serine hydrolase [Candidatus Saccharibacteria bacterium]|nr:serine hydrolase [Candidatus Saccharibacteria bacterium]